MKTKLDPKQSFVAVKFTREEICNALNEVIEKEEWEVKSFKHDDARLTDEFCQGIVDTLKDAYWDNDYNFDNEYAYAKFAAAEALGIEIENDESDED